MDGKLIVLEGLDGCGKSTQLELVTKALADAGVPVRAVSFPDYQDPSSTLIQMYLRGEFGDTAGEVNAYATSLFYAVDRFASYQRYWRQDYETGTVILAGRYVTSNIIHQMSKLPRSEWDQFLPWLSELEYEKVRIPKPDKVLFLDMPAVAAQKLLSARYQGDESKKDVHERDAAYLAQCRAAAAYAIDRCGWTVIPCAEGENPRSIGEITTDLLQEIRAVL